MSKGKALITGSNGFVGRYLKAELLGQGYQVFGCDRMQGAEEGYYPVDLTKEAEVYALIEAVKPDFVFHLAAQSSVSEANKNPTATFSMNVVSTANLFWAVLKSAPKARVLSIGSSEEYGMIKPADCPISEETPLRPKNPYAISKVLCEELGTIFFREQQLNIIMTRSFNHIGPGQRLGFVVSDFCEKIVKIEKGEIPPVLKVGNLEAVRDFTDVRDVVRAYRLLLEKGEAGQAYNIGSGNGISVKSILEILLTLSTEKIQTEIDPEKLRPSDIPINVCDNGKIRQTTGWKPEIEIKESLREILSYWRSFE